ncbi:hypothetical protein FRC17_006532 [Serendipita sp. 399]|nr:hypothetical protein FRC17_006532 [Serendipita sp. 399]
MSAATRLGPLSAILTTANDLFLTLNFFRNKNAPESVDFSPLERDLPPLPLTLGTPPNLALSLRSLGISKSTIRRICQVYNDRIASMRETTIAQYRSAEMTLSSHNTQLRLADTFIEAFNRSVRDLHDQAIDAAIDTLAITSEQVTSASTSSTSGRSFSGQSSNPGSSSSGSSDENFEIAAKSTPSAAATGAQVFDKSVVPLLEYIFTHQGKKYPTVEEKKQLQAQTGLTYRQIAVWFQNRRARQKKRGEGEDLNPLAIDIESTIAQIEQQQIMQTAAVIPKEKQRIHLVQIVARREIRDIHELPEDLGPNPREIQEAEIRRQINKGKLLGFDRLKPSPNAFPKPFEMPIYDYPTFDPVEYPRKPFTPLQSAPPAPPVSDDELDELSSLFDRLSVDHSKVITFKRRHHIVMTLPENQDLASRIRQRVQSLATQQASEGGIEVWLANRIVYDLRDLEDSLQLQAQVNSPNAAQDDINQEQLSQGTQANHETSHDVAPAQYTQLPPTSTNPTQSTSTSAAAASTTSAAPPATASRRRTRSRRQVVSVPERAQPEVTTLPVPTEPPVPSSPYHHSAASGSTDSLQTVDSSMELNTPRFSTPGLPPEVPDIEVLGYADVFGDKREVLSFPLEFDIMESVPITNESLDEALKMTLTELGYLEQYVEKSFVRIHQAQIQEIPYANIHEDAIANPAILSSLDPIDPEFATNPAYIQDPDPFGTLSQSKKAPPSSWDRDAAIAWAQANYPDVSADTYVGPTLRLYDPLGPSLPFPLSDLNDKPEHFDHPMPSALYEWEPTHPTSLFTFEGKPIPEHDPNLKWETIINYLEKLIQKDQRREIRWAKRQRWPISSVDPRSMLQYLNL